MYDALMLLWCGKDATIQKVLKIGCYRFLLICDKMFPSWDSNSITKKCFCIHISN